MNQAFPGSQAGAIRFAVRVEAPARLHLGFIDVSGSLGRRFGRKPVGSGQSGTEEDAILKS